MNGHLRETRTLGSVLRAQVWAHPLSCRLSGLFVLLEMVAGVLEQESAQTPGRSLCTRFTQTTRSHSPCAPTCVRPHTASQQTRSRHHPNSHSAQTAVSPSAPASRGGPGSGPAGWRRLPEGSHRQNMSCETSEPSSGFKRGGLSVPLTPQRPVMAQHRGMWEPTGLRTGQGGGVRAPLPMAGREHRC